MLLDRLREALQRRTPATLREEGAQRAAVAVVVTAGPEPDILFVRRQERSGDPWSGHMAFPGGFMADAEGSLVATAVRETLEETGLDLTGAGEEIGRLDDVYPRSVLLPKVVVTPVVFGVPATLAVAPGPEVQEVLWLPASQILSPASHQPYTLELPIGTRVFDSIAVDGYIIWGLTERVLSQINPIVAALTD